MYAIILVEPIWKIVGLTVLLCNATLSIFAPTVLIELFSRLSSFHVCGNEHRFCEINSGRRK
jgi:hypothetical protein